MPLVLNGDGLIQSLVAGGLPDATVTTADIVDANITAAKLSGAQTGAAPIYGCRAWVNFVGSTGAINASGNVTSVTRNGTGDYTVNFTTAMPDANYSVVMAVQGAADNNALYGNVIPDITRFTTALATGSVRVGAGIGGGSGRADPTIFSVAIFR